MPFTMVRNDITKMAVDAIVNAADTALQAGGGVSGAIFAAAGQWDMQAACNALAPIKFGEAVITPGFALPAKYVIHAAPPVWYGGGYDEETQLRACYQNTLALALENGCESIAFPLLASGIYGYPKAEALAVAMSEIRAFLHENEIEAYLVLFDKTAFSLSEQLLGSVHSFVDEHYIAQQERRFGRARLQCLKDVQLLQADISAPAAMQAEMSFQLDEPFTKTLFRLIDSKGRTDVEVYKRANIDRRLFSKIRSNEGYIPSKRTAVALAVALELDERETRDLLERAGYSLSRSVLFDVIIEYFIANKKYDIFEINEVLFHYEQALLGG